MSNSGIGIENNGNVNGQTIINIQSMSGNIGAPAAAHHATPIFLPGSPSSAVKPIFLSNEYYNLFVIGNKDISGGRFCINDDRSLTETAFTESWVTSKFKPLDDDKISKICTFPSLFMNECIWERGKIAPTQTVYFGFVSRLQKRREQYIIEFQVITTVPMELIIENRHYLDIQADYTGCGEPTRTHWAIKEVGLVDELRRTGFDVFGATK
jgi:hypothetical protein